MNRSKLPSSASTFFVLVFALAALVGYGCSSKEETSDSDTMSDSLGAEADTMQNTQFEITSEPSEETQQKPEPKTEAPKPKTETKPKPPTTVAIEVPSGMSLPITLGSDLETGKTQAGDTFTATLDSAIVVEGRTIFPAGSVVEGTVTKAVASGRLKTEAEISMTLTSIDGKAVTTSAIEDKAASHKSRNTKIIGGSAVVGGIIGAIKGKDVKGAVLGAAVGAAAGTGVAALTGKQDLKYASGSKLLFTLTEPVSVTVPK